MKMIKTLLLSLLISIGAQSQEVNLKSMEIGPKIDVLVDQYMELDIFSGVVLVAQRGEHIYHKAFGLANRASGKANTLNTHFDIGSMNKTFTKVIILDLVDQGKLKLEDNLGEFLDGFPYEVANKVTIGHLLSHQSGLAGYHSPEYWDLPFEEKNLQTVLQFIRQQPLWFEPGTDRQYSNSGYVLLGLIAEKVTGQSYFDLVQTRIVGKLGMSETYLREKYATPNRAIGYYKDMKGTLISNDSLREIVTPAGGFYSTASDMMKFYRAFHYGNQLWSSSAKSLDDMYPFYQEHMNTGGAMTHAGGFEGANTVHYEILRDEISVVVFANMDEVVAEDLGAGILAIIRDKKPEKPQLPAGQSVYAGYEEKGIGFVKQNWDDLTGNFHPDDPKDMILNHVGYMLMREGNISAAKEMFQLNTELFPKVANCWDSYGESLWKSGEIEAAKKAYLKALKIRPDLESAKAALDELKKI
ncbi:MAG: serine hydrolase [Marinoscillum sp.]